MTSPDTIYIWLALVAYRLIAGRPTTYVESQGGAMSSRAVLAVHREVRADRAARAPVAVSGRANPQKYAIQRIQSRSRDAGTSNLSRIKPHVLHRYHVLITQSPFLLSIHSVYQSVNITPLARALQLITCSVRIANLADIASGSVSSDRSEVFRGRYRTAQVL